MYCTMHIAILMWSTDVYAEDWGVRTVVCTVYTQHRTIILLYVKFKLVITHGTTIKSLFYGVNDTNTCFSHDKVGLSFEIDYCTIIIG